MSRSAKHRTTAASSSPWTPSCFIQAGLSLLLTLSSVGCGGYFPLRWPRSDLWSAPTNPAAFIRLPSSDLAAYPNQVQKDRVSVVVELIDREQAKQQFHADLLGVKVQPLMLVIHNGSDQTYAFRKADVVQGYLPAASVARWAYVSPLETIARSLKWATFFLPGLVFESVIEPMTTLDFPGIEEAAQRPPPPNNQLIKSDFMRHEIADAQIRPNSTLAGVLFTRPLKLGSVIPVTLINAQTQQPLVVEVSVPPPLYTESHTYYASYDAVWETAVKTAAGLRAWRVTSTDKNSGTMTARKGVTFLRWSTATTVTLRIQKVNERRTTVRLESPLRRSDSTAYGERSPTVDKFFLELDRKLPTTEEQPAEKPSSSQPQGGTEATTGEPSTTGTPQTPAP